MRRVALVAALSCVLAGCGGSEAEDAVRSWNDALNAGDNYAAAALFAPGARAEQGGVVLDVGDYGRAIAFNKSLPCSGTIVELAVRGNVVTVTVVLGERERVPPWVVCEGAGREVKAEFVVENGEIVLWRQLDGADGSS